MQTQREKVRAHLEKEGNITSWEAITKYKITRLAEYIYELRKEGFEIRTEYRTNKEGVTYAVYWWDENNGDDNRSADDDRTGWED